MNGPTLVLTVICCLGSALLAGVFFAFSTLVMTGLAALPAPAAVSAMQAVNRAAVRPLFLFALLGTTVGCVALVVVTLISDAPVPALPLIGSGLFLVGALGLTIAYHIPRNEALDRLDSTGGEATAHWSRYLRGWTALNHVRCTAALAAAAVLLSALVVL